MGKKVHTQKERKKDSWAMRDFRDVCMKSVPLADVCCFTCAQSTCVHTHTHTPYMPNAAMHCLSVQRSIVSFRNGIQSEAARHTHTPHCHCILFIDHVIAVVAASLLNRQTKQSANSCLKKKLWHFIIICRRLLWNCLMSIDTVR